MPSNPKAENENANQSELSRRELFGGAAAVAAGLAIVPRHVLGGLGQTSPSEKIALAVIGTGCQGMRHVQSLLANQPDVQIVAVCDVNCEGSDYFDLQGGVAGLQPARKLVEGHYADARRGGTYRGCTAYRDFRELFEKEQDLDAVLIATPDHTHAVVAMQAIRRGKHVYCEKPLTHTIDEARKLVEAARTAKVASQMGNQLHALETVRLQVELIWSGVIGPVRRVYAWCTDTGWHGPWSAVRQRRWAAIGTAWNPGPDRPQDTPPVPAGLDWDLWLGPAPQRPYHPAYLPFKWRGWWDFGSGTLGDMGCHILDPVFWALDLKAPLTVEASSARITPETAPVAAMVHYEFPARGDMPPLELIWYEGGLKPARPNELAEGRDLPTTGVLYIGDEAKLLVPYGAAPILLPESRFKDLPRPQPTLPRITLEPRGPDPLSVSLHHREWLDACKGGPAPLSHFSYAGSLTETVLLGVVAIRTGQKLHWDAANMKITNAPTANVYIRTPYREGWTL